MKKLITILTVLIFASMHAQEMNLYIGIDARNQTLGSEQTNYKPATDIIIGSEIQLKDSPIFIGVEVESFKKIEYVSLQFVAGVKYPLSFYGKNRIELMAYPELTKIYRFGFRSRYNTVLSYGFNGEIRYQFDNLFLGLKYNVRKRTELMDNYFVESGYLKIGYKLW